MKKLKLFTSILMIILVFFLFAKPVNASIFSDDDKNSEIEDTIDKDEGVYLKK